MHLLEETHTKILCIYVTTSKWFPESKVYILKQISVLLFEQEHMIYYLTDNKFIIK